MEDSSNFDLTYARNRLRQGVMPVLRELNPAFVSTLTANLDHLREDRDLLDAMAQRAIQEARVVDGRVSIPASTLAALDHPIAVRAVKGLLAKVDYYQISSVHLDQILALAASTSPSASHNLPGDLFVWREYDRSGPLPVGQHAGGLLPAAAHRPGDLPPGQRLDHHGGGDPLPRSPGAGGVCLAHRPGWRDLPPDPPPPPGGGTSSASPAGGPRP